MRNEKDWTERVVDLYIERHYPPRLANDLRNLALESGKDFPEDTVSMYLHGKSDYGKTVLACFMMLQEQKKIYFKGGPENETDRCVFITMTDLINNIKWTYDKKSAESEKILLTYYSNCHLLVLDDFGIGKPTDWFLHILYTIINHRYDYQKMTIFTSNFSLEEVGTVLGDTRITSRIERMCQIIEKQNWKIK